MTATMDHSRSASKPSWPLAVAARSGPAVGDTSALRSLFRKSLRYGWLLADQAVFAVANLILNLLFAQWLTAYEYGRFGVTFSGYILLSVLHWYVVVEPLLVSAASIQAEQVRSYVATVIRAHLILLGAAAIISGTALWVGWAAGVPETGLAIAVVSSGGCALLTLATARRLCLAFLSPALSALAGSFYLVASVVTAWLLHRSGFSSWLVLWAVMSGWGIASAAGLCAVLLARPRSHRAYHLRDLVRSTARYARWGSVTAGFSWVRTDGIYVVLAIASGLPAVAQARAIVTLNAPVSQVNAALNAAWLIDFGRRRGDPAALLRTIVQRVRFYVFAALIALAAIFYLGHWITHVAYRGKYDAGAALMPLFLLAFLINGIENVLTSAMKTRGLFRDGYLPQMVGSVAVALTAVALIPTFGTTGAAVAVVVGAVAGCGLSLLLFWRSRGFHG